MFKQNTILISLVCFLFLVFAFAFTGVLQAEEVPYGGWLDEIVIIEENTPAAAITQLEMGDIGIFGQTLTDPDIFEEVKASEELDYIQNFGSLNELTFNPAGPVFEETGKLNPFAVKKIREAMHFLVDRDYIADEVLGGMAVPRFFPISSSFPDYADMIVDCRKLEAKYAYNPAFGEEIFKKEMEKLGAKKENGTWYFEGEPVEIKVLIRTEDERKELGDYIASIMDDLGFEVERRYATASEASPIWIAGDPESGKFHIYTGGWLQTVVSRDQTDNFDFFYTPRGLAFPLWQAYQPSEEFDQVADSLNRRDFETLEERKELFARALELSMEDNIRMFLTDQRSITPLRSDVAVSGDLAGGVSGSFLWPHTVRYQGKTGGEMQIALPSIMTEPWNPLNGSNWIFDMMLIRATGELGYMWDPYTGLHHPHRIERADLFIKEGLPVGKTLDWVNLQFVEENIVPEDAWIDWDPEAQEFITVGEKHPDGLTANRKVRTYYPDDFLDKLSWHDGSPFSVADIVFAFILDFDRGMEESPFFDEAQLPSYQSFKQHFRGFKIVSTDPLIVEYYSDLYYLDAEWYIFSGFPYFDQGPGAWHNLSLGYLAEVNGEVAFSSDKADKMDVEWLNMIGGPSLEILENKIQQAKEDNFIPYQATLGDFVSVEEAQERWSNLESWYQEKDHFWLGTGPYYLEAAHPVEGIVQLRRNEDYPNRADRWEVFSEPLIPEVYFTGPGLLKAGTEAVYDVSITFDDDPYPAEHLDTVSYILFDSSNQIVASGDATFVSEGEWEVTLTPEITSKLSTGTSKLEVITTSKAVSLPSIRTVKIVSIN